MYIYWSMERFLHLVAGCIKVKEFPNREHCRINQPFLLYNEDDFLNGTSTCSLDPVFCNYGKNTKSNTNFYHNPTMVHYTPSYPKFRYSQIV